MTNAHRRRNQLTRVKVNGRWLTEESLIKEEVSKAFQGLLADPGGWKPNIDGQRLKMHLWRGDRLWMQC